jgi:3-deoxy-manno-octulosonate cytidylyltransferase (CMP-KDO synthetase)
MFDGLKQSLYFSKNIIPYAPPASAVMAYPVHLHLGVYAYRPEALLAYRGYPPCSAEMAEGLEQLRFLDMGVGVGAVVCEPPESSMIELNNPTDTPLIEGELRRLSL